MAASNVIIRRKSQHAAHPTASFIARNNENSSILPDEKYWLAQHSLEMLMLDGSVTVKIVCSCVLHILLLDMISPAITEA
jgi:hypothetical protein